MVCALQLTGLQVAARTSEVRQHALGCNGLQSAALSLAAIYRQIRSLVVAVHCSPSLQIAWLLSSKLKVAGSNPAGVANKVNGLSTIRNIA
jgi:hypothetical protein